MDGLGQLFIAQNGSVYALVPADSREPPPRHVRASLPLTEQEVTTALLSQFLQRQQQQQQQQQQQEQEEHEQRLRQQQLALQLDGLAALPNVALHREDALQSLLQATLMQSYPDQAAANLNSNAGPSTSSHLGPAGPVPGRAGQGRRLPSVESPSNSTRSGRSESQSPPPSARGGERSERSNGLGVSAQMSAKEKNRQAQRRFRERQKDLIANLKQRVEDLQNQVTDNEKEIIALKEENAMLRGRMEGKQQVSLPAETLQSLLQMTGAGGILSEAQKPARGGGAGGGGGGSSSGGGGSQAYRTGRGADAAMRGADVAMRGADVAMRGGDVAMRGGDVAMRGGDVAMRGADVAMRGADVAIRGADVAMRGADVAMRGGDVAMRGAKMAVRGGDVAMRSGDAGPRSSETGRRVDFGARGVDVD